MKKLYFLLLTLITTISFAQTEIFNAGGGGAYPSAGWSDVNNVTAQAIDQGSYYLINSGSPGDEITTAVYDLSTYSSAEFSLDFRSYGGGTHNETKIEVSFDGGATFTQTELTPVTTTSYTSSGTIALSSVTNQVQIKISSNGTSGRGIRLRNLVLTGISSNPFIAITAPTNNTEFGSGTTTVDVSLDVQNFIIGNPGAGIDGHIHWTLNGVAQPMKYDVLDETITTVDGGTYVVVMTLVDNTHTPVSPAVTATVTFTIAYPCDLMLGTETATCVTETAGTDTYNVTLDFTGGNTSTYTIVVNEGSVGGDNPSTMTAGTITINGITEGTNLAITITGDVANSSCTLNETISSPTCVPSTTCAAAGEIIVSEIMKNPSAVGDTDGEYFEVYNTTSSPIDMIGWEISDDGSDSHIIGASLIVPAMGYAVLGINANTGTNGGVNVDYEYSSYSLSNGSSGDEINLICGSTLIDAVAYNNGDFPNTAGVAMELSSTALNSISNDDGANWGNATMDLGNGDFGTPGAANAFTLSTTTFQANAFNIYPNPTSTGFVNIATTSNKAVNVTVFNILGKQVINTVLSTKRLNVSNLNAGVYILQLNQNGATTTKKLVIK